MNTKDLKLKRKLRRKRSIASKIRGTAERPRLSVFKSNTNIFCQIIDDDNQKTIVSASSIDKDIRQSINAEMKPKDVSQYVGKIVAERAKEKNITRIIFDRNGNIYTGRIKALADAAREGGLEF